MKKLLFLVSVLFLVLSILSCDASGADGRKLIVSLSAEGLETSLNSKGAIGPNDGSVFVPNLYVVELDGEQIFSSGSLPAAALEFVTCSGSHTMKATAYYYHDGTSTELGNSGLQTITVKAASTNVSLVISVNASVNGNIHLTIDKNNNENAGDPVSLALTPLTDGTALTGFSNTSGSGVYSMSDVPQGQYLLSGNYSLADGGNAASYYFETIVYIQNSKITSLVLTYDAFGGSFSVSTVPTPEIVHMDSGNREYGSSGYAPASLASGTNKLKVGNYSSSYKYYYTTDGTDPTTSSTEYTAALSVSNKTTFKVIAVNETSGDVSEIAVRYGIGQRGPAGGWVFYNDFVGGSGNISGNNSSPSSFGNGTLSITNYTPGFLFTNTGDRFHYLEMAPDDIHLINGVPSIDENEPGFAAGDTNMAFGHYITEQGTLDQDDLPTPGLDFQLGGGYTCTNAFISSMGAEGENAYLKVWDGSITTITGNFKNYAANACAMVSLNGFDDWFMPNVVDFAFMLFNLAGKSTTDLTEALRSKYHFPATGYDRYLVCYERLQPEDNFKPYAHGLYVCNYFYLSTLQPSAALGCKGIFHHTGQGSEFYLQRPVRAIRGF